MAVGGPHITRLKRTDNYIKTHGLITNAEYQHAVGCPQRTATRDLNELVQIGIVELEGEGRGTQYKLKRNRAIIAPNAPSENG
jgi:predicted DNA-binding transcriptional regulator YafY